MIPMSESRVVADTNVFLRFLTNDIPLQAEAVQKRLAQARDGKIAIIVLPITIVELMFHLEKWYRFTAQQAAQKCALLISPAWITMENKPSMMLALSIYPTYSIDFVDILTWCAAQTLNAKILSFDKDYDKLPEKIRLTP